MLPGQAVGEGIVITGEFAAANVPVAGSVPAELVSGAGTTGAGIVITGLTPALLISVDPSGIAPPASDDPGAAPGVRSGEAVPVEETVAALQPAGDIPPPSKVELGVDRAGCELPAPKDGIVPKEQRRGLKPPGLTSVAPSGMPVGAPEVRELSPASGDVAPRPGELERLCA
jgi:hypothetical protein